jgi:hypothetical protein
MNEALKDLFIKTMRSQLRMCETAIEAHSEYIELTRPKLLEAQDKLTEAQLLKLAVQTELIAMGVLE